MTPSEQSNDRVIRVFISSTFRDMMQERDLLVKEVFPELRRKCAKRFVTFTEIDLRWGITEQQANEGQVLPLCLAEIERSRPYFIGLLGERYGWVPDTIRPEVIEREPWLKEHVQGRTSVTELEILHGVLRNPAMAGHAFFYFRDPEYAYNPALTDDECHNSIEHDLENEVEKYGPVEAIRRTQERRAKLAALKQRIRDSKLPLVEPYADPKSLAEIVRRQFDELIDLLYPENQTPDPLMQERMAHEAHAKNKLFACIDRPAHLVTLNAFASSGGQNGKGLVVTGESGGGKTSLLAAWARGWKTNHPEDFMFQHYFGATPDSASPDGFLRRLLGELKKRFGINDSIPADSEELREALPVWLARSAAKSRILLVLDGLNQVQGTESDRRLQFLPRRFPLHVTVLASALPGPALDALLERGWAEHDLPRASEAEGDAMVGEYLNIHARTLEEALRHELVSSSGAKNPLFLRTVLDELRQFGSFEQLPQRVRHYLEAEDSKDLFQRVLARWQDDFDGKNPESDLPKFDLVRRALTHLWAARQGLSESEWLDLLGDGSLPLPRAHWTPLFLALEPHLSQRAGLFAFGHDFLRQAVESMFVPAPEAQRQVRVRLADYFGKLSPSPRRTLEFPWLLNEAGQWDRLQLAISDPALIKDIWNLDEMGLWRYLAHLHENTGFTLETAYKKEIFAGPLTPDTDLLFLLLNILRQHNANRAVKAINATLAWYAKKDGDSNLAFSVNQEMAKTFYDMGDLAAAEEQYKSAIALCRNKAELRGELQSALYELGLVANQDGNFDVAITCLTEARQIAIELRESANQIICLFVLAGAYMETGELAMARNCLAEGESICQSTGDQYSLLGILHEKAALLVKERNFEDALCILDEKEKLCREFAANPQLLSALNMKGLALLRLNRPQDALAVLSEGLSLARLSEKPHSIASFLGNIALAYAGLGHHDQASEAMQEASELVHNKRLVHLTEQLKNIHMQLLFRRGG